MDYYNTVNRITSKIFDGMRKCDKFSDYSYKCCTRLRVLHSNISVYESTQYEPDQENILSNYVTK